MNKKISGGLQNKVCRNHPDRPAATRCETCFTPVCEECIYERHGLSFCSRNCAANYDVVNRNLDRFQAKKKTDRRLRFRRRISRLLRIAVYPAILLILWWFYVNNTEQIHRWLDRILNFVN